MTETDRLNVWHVSGDFPDPLAARKTPVIRRLVDLTAGQFSHRVISINRRAPYAEQVDLAFDHGMALTYPAPPFGLLHATMLRRLGNRIARFLPELGRPDLLVAHKLTIEGIAVFVAARQLGVPYALVVQGNTDCKIVRARPDLRPLFRRIYHGARHRFHLAPWSRAEIEAVIGARTTGSSLLPCPMADDAALAPQTGGAGFISVFNLDGYRNKNLGNIAKALNILSSRTDGVQCRIAGDGDSRTRAACQAIARRAPGMELLGHLDQPELARMTNASIAMVLPSKRESFGLAYLEALMAGVPIIHSRNAGVSGYFDGAGFAVPVNPSDPRDIAAAMAHAIANEAAMKRELEVWQKSKEAQRFKRASIAAEFTAGLRSAVNGEITLYGD